MGHKLGDRGVKFMHRKIIVKIFKNLLENHSAKKCWSLCKSTSCAIKVWLNHESLKKRNAIKERGLDRNGDKSSYKCLNYKRGSIPPHPPKKTKKQSCWLKIRRFFLTFHAIATVLICQDHLLRLAMWPWTSCFFLFGYVFRVFLSYV